MSYKILIIGNAYDNHIVRFVKYLKQYNPSVEIDLFCLKQPWKDISVDCTGCLREFFLADCDPRFFKIKGLSGIEWVLRIKNYFHKVVAQKQYDIINIHYPTYYQTFILKDIKRITKKLVLTPWGSDVYRISDFQRKILKHLYDSADIVTGNGLRFTQDFMKIYSIPESKFRKLSIYTDQIDYYIDHKDSITVEEAKQKIGIGGNYVITCGYNANIEQQHLSMVDAIEKVKDKLPAELTLLFPFTYGGTAEYKEQVKNRVKELGLKAVYFETYLKLEVLFVMRKATDMFVHVQTTDANNATLYEYLWFGKNIVNGGWLKYNNLEKDGYKPYHTTPTLDDLGNTIIQAYHDGPIEVKPSIIQGIERSGYKNLVPKWNAMFESIIENSNCE